MDNTKWEKLAYKIGLLDKNGFTELGRKFMRDEKIKRGLSKPRVIRRK